MRFYITALFISWGLLTFAYPSNYQSSIDSLSSLIYSHTGTNDKLNEYQKTFEAYKLSQFKIAQWAAHGGLELALKSNIKDQAYFSEAVGYSYQKLFVMDSALSYYLKALELYKEMEEPLESARVLDAIARIHRKLQNHEKALWYYSQAFAIHDEMDDDEGRARILNERGAVYENMGETRKALHEYQASLKIQLVRGDSVGIGYSLEFIGYNYLQQDSLELSEEYLLRALEYRENMRDEFALMLNHYALGELYHEKGEYELSDAHLNQCFELSEKLSFADIQQYALDIAISNRKALGDFEQAIALLERKTNLSDSLDQVANQVRVDELSEKYQSVERENQILLQKSEIQKQNYWIYALSVSSFLLLLIGILIYKQQRLRQAKIKQEAELKLAKITIENQNRLQDLRMEISRDLHDNIGTQLTFVISSIDSVKQVLSEDDNMMVETRLERISSFTRDTIRELRDTIWAMNTADITIEDLSNRLVNFVNQAGQSMQGVRFEFNNELDDSSTIHFNSKEGMGVYRIIQEAVNNAMKHAKAKKIEVTLSQQGDELSFTISDDGVGLGDYPKRGNGMQTMKKRSQDLNGKLSVHSSTEGTQVTLILSAITE
ncbi:tetratricopeptide repeat-containing sensor histidine kinase [Phaeocystidibacter marisrubri]|uniref:histidine kinase n=1 Tax=Phaeocystidibacter marisrubri TaxID=1577780 RepID=A0A6L3ZHJ4_9FLAO|nr:ATP-binding protein [Phaeocystidibacter marisrubri]KAB2817109.1 tetratricopeptide repeat protein [Phaeocystidibacter marisrubri]GGH76827.1 hypothetical protein GCM10011318_25680 [Phaeocystidibacter marisrubri]